MPRKLLTSLLFITMILAFQLSGIKVYAATGKQQTAKTEAANVKQSVHHNQLIAETGAEIHLPALQITASADACLTSNTALSLTQVTDLYLNNRLTVPTSRFYRLILFPFHGFW